MVGVVKIMVGKYPHLHQILNSVPSDLSRHKHNQAVHYSCCPLPSPPRTLKDKTGVPQNVVRLVLVTMTGLVVSAVPNFAVLMSLIGATCCTLLAFILPAAFHLSIFRQ